MLRIFFAAIGGSQLIHFISAQSGESEEDPGLDIPEIEVIDYSDVDGDTEAIPGQDPIILRKSSNVLAFDDDLSKMNLNQDPLSGFAARSSMGMELQSVKILESLSF